MAMIQGIQGYNNSETVVAGEGKKLPAGNYICEILNVKVEKSQAGRLMLVIQYDIKEGEYAKYYQNMYKVLKETNKDTKYRGIYYQLMDGDNTKYYKGFITSIEKSNNIKIDAENGFDSSLLIGKVFGGKFGEEEYEYNGDIKTTTKLRYVTSVDKLCEAKILELKKLANSNKDVSKDYYSIEEITEDNLPF